MSNVENNSKENLSSSLTSMDWLQSLNAETIDTIEPSNNEKPKDKTEFVYCRHI